MNRKSVISVAIVIIAILILASVLTATMPIWFIVLMINPRIIEPIREKIVAKFMLEMSRTMIRGMKGKKIGVIE